MLRTITADKAIGTTPGRGGPDRAGTRSGSDTDGPGDPSGFPSSDGPGSSAVDDTTPITICRAVDPRR